jgi:hypothetical protein
MTSPKDALLTVSRTKVVEKNNQFKKAAFLGELPFLYDEKYIAVEKSLSFPMLLT